MSPIVVSLSSYVKDSHYALQIFRDFNSLGEEKVVFIMDITSLYTVIPNGEGRLALKHFFYLLTVKEPRSETLLRLAELVIHSRTVILKKSMAWPWVPKWYPATLIFS